MKTKKKIKPKDYPLCCYISGGVLTVRIGIDILKFAAEHGDGNPKVKILSAKTLAVDVRQELIDEDEVGATMLTDVFDKAITAAMENGSVAFADTENYHHKL